MSILSCPPLDETFFVGPVSEQLVCPICVGVTRNPTCCPDEHLFCEPCITLWLKTHDSCPVDRAPMSSQSIKKASRVVCNMVNELKMNNCINECESNWSGTVESMFKHLQTSCPIQMLSCPFQEHGCTFTGRRTEMHAHTTANVRIHDELAAQSAALKKQKEALEKEKLPSQPASSSLSAAPASAPAPASSSSAAAVDAIASQLQSLQVSSSTSVDSCVKYMKEHPNDTQVLIACANQLAYLTSGDSKCCDDISHNSLKEAMSNTDRFKSVDGIATLLAAARSLSFSSTRESATVAASIFHTLSHVFSRVDTLGGQIPVDRLINMMLDIIQSFAADNTVQRNVLRCLANIPHPEKMRSTIMSDPRNIQIILKSISSFPTCATVQSIGCVLLTRFSQASESFPQILAQQADVIPVLKGVMKTHADNAQAVAASSFAAALVCDADTAIHVCTDRFLEDKGLDLLLGCMKKHETHMQIQGFGSLLMSFLLTNPAALSRFVSLGGVQLIVSTIRRYQEEPAIMDNVFRCVRILSFNSNAMTHMQSLRGRELVAEITRQNSEEPAIMQCASEFMFNSDLFASYFAAGSGQRPSEDADDDMCKSALSMMNSRRQDPMVQLQCCTRLKILITSPESSAKLQEVGVMQVVLNAMKTFARFPQIQSEACEVLEYLMHFARPEKRLRGNFDSLVETIVNSMEIHGKDEVVQLRASSALKEMPSNVIKSCGRATAAALVNRMFATIEAFPACRPVQEGCLSTISVMVVENSDAAQAVLSRPGSLALFIATANRQLDDPSIINSCLCCLMAICKLKMEVIFDIMRHGGAELAVASLNKYRGNETICLCAALLLSALANDKKNHDAIVQAKAIEALVASLRSLSNSRNVAVASLGALYCLAPHPRTKSALAACNATEIISAAKRAFGYEEQVSKYCDGLLSL